MAKQSQLSPNFSNHNTFLVLFSNTLTPPSEKSELPAKRSCVIASRFAGEGGGVVVLGLKEFVDGGMKC